MASPISSQRPWRKTSLAVGMLAEAESREGKFGEAHRLAHSGDAFALDSFLQEQVKDLDPTQIFTVVDEKSRSTQQTPLQISIMEGHQDAVMVLLERGASLETSDINGRTPMLYCARYGRLGLAKILFKKGANMEATDTFGDGALAIAASQGFERMASWLLDVVKVSVNDINVFGETPLHKAARTGDTVMIGLLLEYDADTRAVGDSGRPRDVAENPLARNMLRSSTMVPGVSPTTPRDVFITPSKRPMSPLVRVTRQDSFNDSGSESSVEFLSGSFESIDSSSEEEPIDETDEAAVARSLSILRAQLRRQKTSEMNLDLNLKGVTETIKSARTEWKRKKSFDEQRGTHLLATPREDDGVMVEINEPGPRLQLETNNLYEPYREMFQDKPHDTYSCQDSRLVITVAREQHAEGRHQALMRSEDKGYELLTLVVPEKKKVEDVLDERWPGTTEDKKKRKGRWKICPSSIKPFLVQFEGSVGRPRALHIGVLLGRGSQTEAEMMENSLTDFELFERFMTETLKTTMVELKGFSGYNGGKKHGPAFYTRWRGFEVIFFVASMMTADERRKHIGNSKVLLYYYEQEQGEKLRCHFRGHVNSYAIVASPLTEDKYDVACFRRVGVEKAHPKLTSLSLMGNLVRDCVLSKAANAQEACYRFLYGSRLKSIYSHEMDTLFANMESKLKKKGGRLSMLLHPKKKQ